MRDMRLVPGLALSALCALQGTAAAQDIAVRVNGQPVAFSGVGPQEIQGRVMVPLRGVLERLGAYVDWLPSTQTVVASRGNLDLQMAIGSRTATINGKQVQLDVPAMTLAGRTMVPLRFVGEALGANVSWDAPTRAVLIQTNGQQDTQPTHRVENTGGQTPPAAQITAPTVDAIETSSGESWLRAGDTVTITLRGSAGARADLRLPGVANSVPMSETRPGVYRATWTVPADKALQNSDVAVLGTLRAGGQASPIIQAGRPLRIDNQAPTIGDLNPQPGAAVAKPRPLVSATFTDGGGSGIAVQRTRLTVDGRNVTEAASVTGQFVSFTPDQPLEAGTHAVQLVVADEAGNVTRKEWTFRTSGRRSGIRSVKTNAEGTLEPGDVVNVTVEGAPGSRAAFSLGPVKGRPLTEQSPGVYTGSYTIRKGDDVGQAPVVVTLTDPDGTAYTESTERAVRVVTGPPAAPVITYPGPNDKPANPLVVKGTAAPGSTVRLRISYTNRVLGIFAVNGTAAEQDVPVDKGGHWQSKPIDISSLLGSRNTQYTLSAVAVSPTQEQSPATTMSFR